MKYCISTLVFLGLSFASAQNRTLDSLINELKRPHDDTTQVLILIKTGFTYAKTSADSVRSYTSRAMDLAGKVNFRRGTALGYNNLGLLEFSLSNYSKAIEHIERYLKISQEINSEEDISKALNNLGIMYKLQGHFPKALSYFQQALAANKDRELKAKTLNNIGTIYKEMGDYTKALEYHFSSLDMKQGMGIEESYAPTYSNIGLIYVEMQDFDRAMENYMKALHLYEKYDDQRNLGKIYREIGIIHMQKEDLQEAQLFFQKAQENAEVLGTRVLLGNIYNDLGAIHQKQGNYTVAIQRFNSALSLFRDINHQVGEVEALYLLASTYFDQKRYSESESTGLECLEISMQIQSTKKSLESYHLLHQIYQKKKDFQKAYEFATLYNELSDRVGKDVQTREIELLQARYDMENENLKLQMQNELSASELIKSQLKIQQRNLMIYGSIVLLLFLFLSSFMGYRLLIGRRDTIQLLKAKNQEILFQQIELKRKSKELKMVNKKVRNVNGSLEGVIKKRTARILEQNKRLQDYAFSNAHLVREPLARIMGLTEILKARKDITLEQKHQLNDSILESANELDQIIRKVGEILNQEDTGPPPITQE